MENGQLSPFWKVGKFYLHTRAIIQSEITIFGNFEGPKVTKNMKKKHNFLSFGPKKSRILDMLTKNIFLGPPVSWQFQLG